MNESISWDDQRAFLVVLEEGSLSAAAKRLGVTQPTVRARIDALESALDTVLFTRSVQGLTPTPRARQLGEAARMMAHASEAFVRQATSGEDESIGTVRLSASEFVGIVVLPSMLRRLADKHPGIEIELEASNAQADLLEQQVDIAIRMTRPRQAALVIRKVPTIRLGFYASTDYAARHGLPCDLEALASHRLIGPDRNRADLSLAQAVGHGLPGRAFKLRTDSHAAALHAVRAGLGIGVVHRPTGDADPSLRAVLPELDVAAFETWIVAHERLLPLLRIRAVFDHLVEEFMAYGSKESG